MPADYVFNTPLHSAVGRGTLHLGLRLLEEGAAAALRRRSIAYSPMELQLITKEGGPLTAKLLDDIGVSIGQLIDFCSKYANSVAEALTPNAVRQGSRLIQMTFKLEEGGIYRLVLGFATPELANLLEPPEEGIVTF